MDHARSPARAQAPAEDDRSAAPADEGAARPLPDGLRRHYSLGAGDAFARAMDGGRATLPHQGELQRSFGFDLSTVRASVGRQAELVPLGAKAAARGDEVAFASRAPSKDEVAHELVHVGQARGAQARGAVQALSTVGSDGSPAEREAESLGARAAAGEKVQTREAPGAGIHLIKNEELQRLLDEYSSGHSVSRARLAEKFAEVLGSIQLADIDESVTRKLLFSCVSQFAADDGQTRPMAPREQEQPRKLKLPPRDEKEKPKEAAVEKEKEQPQQTIPKEVTSVEQFEFVIARWVRELPEYPELAAEARAELQRAIDHGGGKVSREVIWDVMNPVKDRWDKRRSAKEYEGVQKSGKPGLYRQQDLSVQAQLVPRAEESIEKWKSTTEVGQAEGAIDPMQADRYLDVLHGTMPQGANNGAWCHSDGLKGSDVTSNCSLTSMVPLFGCKSSEIPKWLDGGKQQSTGTLQPKGEEGLKGGSGSQLDGMKAFASRVISPHLRLEDPQMQKNGARAPLPVAVGIELMQSYSPGTQFVCLLTFPGAHYVYAERRGEKDVKFEDWQPVVDLDVGPNRDSPMAKLAQPQPTTTFNQASPVPFEKDPDAYKVITFLAFVPDKALVDQVVGDGHGGAHDAIRGHAQRHKK